MAYYLYCKQQNLREKFKRLIFV